MGQGVKGVKPSCSGVKAYHTQSSLSNDVLLVEEMDAELGRFSGNRNCGSTRPADVCPATQ